MKPLYNKEVMERVEELEDLFIELHERAETVDFAKDLEDLLTPKAEKMGLDFKTYVALNAVIHAAVEVAM